MSDTALTILTVSCRKCHQAIATGLIEVEPINFQGNVCELRKYVTRQQFDIDGWETPDPKSLPMAATNVDTGERFLSESMRFFCVACKGMEWHEQFLASNPPNATYSSKKKLKHENDQKPRKPYDAVLVNEEDLVQYIERGWEVITELSNGRIALRRLAG
jgi:hypothetical protein